MERVDAPVDVSVVVPAKDEAESLPDLAEQIRSALGGAGLTFEVWIVDDGSADGTWAATEALHAADARFAGVRFRRNYGKSAALAAGFARARGEFVATLDADLQDDPAELPEMIARLQAGADLVSGWKRKRNDPWEKRLPSKFFNGVTRAVSGIALRDFNSGIKAYRAEVAKSVRVYGELHRYIPLLAKWEGYGRIEEQAVNHRPRLHGRTKFGLERYLRGFLDLLTVFFLTRFARRPMHFFGGLGTLLLLLGFGVLAWLSVAKLAFGDPIGDRPLLLFGVLTLLLGAQSFFAGLLGEMVVRPELEDARTYDVREELPPAASEGGLELPASANGAGAAEPAASAAPPEPVTASRRT